MIRAEALKQTESQLNADAVLREVLDGLTQAPKRLPSKLFYDARGSALFEQICGLDEYYLTRTELDILTTHIDEIVRGIGPGRVLLEYGSGASVKTRLLLDALESPVAYIPIDICEPALNASREDLSRAYPHLPIFPVCGDYTGPLQLPRVSPPARTVAFFPGSTIGNLDNSAAVEFLKTVRVHCGAGGKLLIGVDLRKDEETLLAAYNDRQGVTAQFNLNILRVLNREYNAYFRPEEFAHRAIWNDAAGRIEMHLVSQCRQTVQVDSMAVRLDAGEPIVTEHCHKYSLSQFRTLSEKGGFRVEQVWQDRRQLFGVHLLCAG